MSVQFSKVCSLILLEHFGEIVEKVGTDLFQWGPKPLTLIASSTKLSIDKVKQSLCVLLQYGLASFAAAKNGRIAEYSLLPEKVFSLLRYPRYLYLIKTKFGVEAEMLVEEFLRSGYDSASKVILRAASRLKETRPGSEGGSNFPLLRDKFVLLVNKQFLVRCPSPSENTDGKASAVPNLTAEKTQLHLPPTLNIKSLTLLQEGETADAGDIGVYWSVNFDRFHQDFRDQIIVSSVSRRIDESASEIFRLLLQLMYIRTEPWARSSNYIPYSELRDTLRKKDPQSPILLHLEQYLKIIEADSTCFLTRVGDSGGGQFCINMYKIFEALTWTCIENIIVERFGSKAARIFRLVKARKHIEQEKIQKIAMIPAREAKQLTYRLLHENFLQLQEIRKSMANNAGPNKMFFLFHIDLEEVARMVLDFSYKALYNAMTRRAHESDENRRLIEKKQRIDSIALNMTEQGATPDQLQEIEEMMAPPEVDLLNKVKNRVQKLSEAELHLEQTIFLMQLFLSYNQQ
ncbi:DNA-directed RNA polymerase III subunit RPC3 [Thrips palmi]|uniref:DNA-directed RNA polymerase III subunit RPC3 n=1 Tax=Thrips palmi TaxID=161013 RepID=A0A6P8Z035_THRPL|nr:DNA-directed RNA polymerase III subunit RPC3 [Thrips palmi]